MGKAAAQLWIGQPGNGIDMHGMLRRERAWHCSDLHRTAAAMTCRGWQSSAEDVVCADMFRIAREKKSDGLTSNEEGR